MQGAGSDLARLRRPLKARRAQALVEYALLLPVLMLVFWGIIEFARLSASWVTIQHAVSEAARYAVTGIGYTAGSGVREAAIGTTARTAARGIIINGSATGSQPGFFQVTIRSSRSTGNPSEPNDAGGPNDFVRVTIQYNHPNLIRLVNSGGYIPLTVSALVINERFARPTGAAGYASTPQLPPTPVPTFTPTPPPVPTPTRTTAPTASATLTPTRDSWCNTHSCNCTYPSYYCRLHHCCD